MDLANDDLLGASLVFIGAVTAALAALRLLLIAASELSTRATPTPSFVGALAVVTVPIAATRTGAVRLASAGRATLAARCDGPPLALGQDVVIVGFDRHLALVTPLHDEAASAGDSA